MSYKTILVRRDAGKAGLMRRLILFATAIAILDVAPAFAQTDEGMELQRCVWRCLARSSGNQDPAYDACVENVCVPKGRPASSDSGAIIPRVGQSCIQTAGPEAAQKLARQCLQVSEATRPPCNAENPCHMMADEIRRSCVLKQRAGIETPNICNQLTGGEAIATPGNDSASVREIQMHLNALGYEPGPVDGVLGNETRRALQRFQRVKNLPSTGKPTPETTSALGRAYESLQSKQPAARASSTLLERDPAASTLGTNSSQTPTFRMNERGQTRDLKRTLQVEGSLSVNIDRNLSCADPPKGQALAKPTKIRGQGGGDPRKSFVYSDGPDKIIVEKTREVMAYYAGAGDDTIYVYGAEAGTGISGESGADTFVVCGLGDVTTLLNLGPVDTEPDTVIVDSQVFAAPPLGNPTISVANFVSVNDRLIVHVPANADVRFGDLEIKVGSVRIKILSGNGIGETAPFNLVAVTVISNSHSRTEQHPPTSFARHWRIPWQGHVQTQSVEAFRAVTLAGAPLSSIPGATSCKEPGQIANPSRPSSVSPAESLGGRYVPYSDGNDVIVSTAAKKALPREIDGRAGDDQFYVFHPVSGTRLFGGSGADRITVCGMDGDEIQLTVVMGEGGGAQDADADTLILQPDVFGEVPRGFQREIQVFEFVPGNDRLILRLPPGKAIAFRDNRIGSASIRVGEVQITIYHTDDLNKPFDWNSVVVVPTTVAVESAASNLGPTIERSDITNTWRWGQPRTLAGKEARIDAPMPSCAEMLSPDRSLALSKPLEAVPDADGLGFQYYTHGDDLIRLAGTRKTTYVRSGRGDDRIYLLDVGDDLNVVSGPGADTIVLCSMHGVDLDLDVGPGVVDAQPDVVVIEPSVFLNVPKGLTRKIQIGGFLPLNDRLVLHLPPGLKVDAKHSVDGIGYNLTVGQVRIRVGGDHYEVSGTAIPEPVIIVPSADD